MRTLLSRLSAVGVILWLTVSAFAQGGCVVRQVIAPPQPTSSGQPVPSAPYRVCTSAATGTGCSPLAPAIYSDLALTQQISNPGTTDASGFYYFCAPYGAYVVQETPVTGTTYSYIAIVPNSATVLYQTVQSEGVSQTQRGIINFKNGITCSDNSSNSSTDCSPTYGTAANTAAQGNDARIVGAVQTTRNINTTAPLGGGGDMSSDRTFTCTTCQVQTDQRQQTFTYAADTGAANAYVVTLTPVPSSYVAPMRVIFKAANANTTVSTLNVNALGAKTIKKLGGSTDLAANDIIAGQIVEVVYDGTNFQMVSPPGSQVAGVTTFNGRSGAVLPTTGDYDGVAQTPTLLVYNAETGGNNLIMPFYFQIAPAQCNGSTATPILELPTSNAPTANCLTGSNTQQATLDFPDSGNTSAQLAFILPADWTGSIDVDIFWLVTASGGSNAMKWTISSACELVGASYDPAFNAAQTITTNVGSNNNVTQSTQSAITITGCTAGAINEIHLKFGRDVTDTFTGTARMQQIGIRIRRSIT